MLQRRVLAASLALLVPALGRAQTVSLPQSGQTVCYAASGAIVACPGTGQDAALAEGVVWPSPRFTVNASATLTDHLTGLTWTQLTASPGVWIYSCSPSDTGETLSWSQALALVACLNSRSYQGHSDWRLPNVNELASLTHLGQADGRVWLAAQGFTDLWTSYWTSTTHVNTSVDNPVPEAYAYTVSMVDGEIGIAAKEGEALPAWPVRGSSTGPAQVWRSGQTQVYAVGDDGYWQRGAVWPSPRFVVEGDCVVDNLTRLIWSKNADLAPGRVGWQAALTAANGLWACGHGDWRLPNALELRSLVDYGQPDLATWLEAQGFVDVQQDASAPYYPYWSSTTREYQTNTAYGVRLDAATEWAFMKDPTLGGIGSVWAVSGGEPAIFADGFESGNLLTWSASVW